LVASPGGPQPQGPFVVPFIRPERADAVFRVPDIVGRLRLRGAFYELTARASGRPGWIQLRVLQKVYHWLVRKGTVYEELTSWEANRAVRPWCPVQALLVAEFARIQPG